MKTFRTDIKLTATIDIEAQTEAEARNIADGLVEDNWEFSMIFAAEPSPQEVNGEVIASIISVDHNYGDFEATPAKVENGIYHSQSADTYYFVSPDNGDDTAWALSGEGMDVANLPKDTKRVEGEIDIVEMFRDMPYRMRAAEFGDYYGYQLVVVEPDAHGIMHVFEIYVRKSGCFIPISTGDWFCIYDTDLGDQDLIAFPDQLVVEQR